MSNLFPPTTEPTPPPHPTPEPPDLSVLRDLNARLEQLNTTLFKIHHLLFWVFWLLLGIAAAAAIICLFTLGIEGELRSIKYELSKVRFVIDY